MKTLLVCALLAFAAYTVVTQGWLDGVFDRPVVKREWAVRMARQAEADAARGAAQSRHRAAVTACMGPAGMALPPRLYDVKWNACEQSLAGAAAVVASTPAAPVAPSPAPAAPEPAEPAAPETAAQ